ncbi:hypothetical protein P4B35_01055 [Pontiellaceae bacterium B12227]|nr:hypothetical protein [Pontiellaceae bacterium B12227]
MRAIVGSACVLASLSAFSSAWTGGGVANDWYDTANWGGSAVASGIQNGLFTTAGEGLTPSDSAGSFGQLQVGRGVANSVTIIVGGAL